MAADGSTALVRAPISAGGQVAAIVAHSFDDAFRIANALAASGITPFKRAEECLAVIMAGAELGLTPFAATQSFAVINGRVSIWGDGMMAVVRARGVRVTERLEGEGDKMLATCTVKRPDDDELVTRTFSMADAKRAGLAGKSGPWTQYPQRMVQMRARAWAIRDACADMLRGMKMAEEMQDVEVVESRSIDRSDDQRPPDERAGEVRTIGRQVVGGQAGKDLYEAFAQRMSDCTDAHELEIVWSEAENSNLSSNRAYALSEHYEACKEALEYGRETPPPPKYSKEVEAPVSPFVALRDEGDAIDDAEKLKTWESKLKAELGRCSDDERASLKAIHTLAKASVTESAGLAGKPSEGAGSVQKDSVADQAGAETLPAPSSHFEALKEEGLACLSIEKPLARKSAFQDWTGKLAGGAFKKLPASERKELETMRETIGKEIGA